MRIEHTEELSDDEISSIRRLWNNEYPLIIRHDELSDTTSYLNRLERPHHMFVVDDKGDILAWFCDFDRDKTRWFVMIVDSFSQKKGLGSILLKEAKKRNEVLNGWIVENDDYELVDGRSYLSPKNFYKKNGFEIWPEISSETHKLKTIKISWKR